MKKLNLGSHNIKFPGYINMDALDLENVNIIHDATKCPWPFPDNYFDEILAIEFLEHISFRNTKKVLCECNRVLKKGGKIKIQVPDCGAMMRYYVFHQVCPCVPHKPKTKEAMKADPKCDNCNGKGMVHPLRWLYSFTGAQKHKFDSHLNIFTKERMKKDLLESFFNNIRFKNNIWKIKVIGEK